MGCIISCGLKLILQILNIVLCAAFLGVALFGILLKASKSVVENIITNIFEQFKIGDKDMSQLAKFIVENADGISIILIVLGFSLAALCLVGCIASCCSCNILLKIYAAILIILVVAQIIAVSVLFSDSNRLSGLLVEAMNELLPFYGEASDKGQTSLSVWNILMTFDKLCCGMDGYADFKNHAILPLQCCNVTSTSSTAACDPTEAERVKMPGCREKMVIFISDNLQTLLYVSIGAILLQVALIAIVFLSICL
nr:tetraspanin [Hymenolepis microstoma]